MVLGKEGRCKGRVGTEERGKRECVCVLGGGVHPAQVASGPWWGENISTTLPRAALP